MHFGIRIVASKKTGNEFSKVIKLSSPARTTTDPTDLSTGVIMRRQSKFSATPDLEQIIAAARGIPVTALAAPRQSPAERLSTALRFQYLARVVRFWYQAEKTNRQRRGLTDDVARI